MPSSASTRLRFEVQALGENLNTWGDTRLNAALNRLEEAIADVVPITMTAANYTLSSNNYIADEARGAVLNLSGTPGGTYQIIIPAVEKTYWVYNATANDQTIGKSGGTTATVRAGRLSFVFCDGSTTYVADPSLDQIKAAAANVSLNSKRITSLADPSGAQDAATKNYVDTKTLDTFAAPVAAVSLNSQKITSLATPTTSTDAATKGYIDTKTLDSFPSPVANVTFGGFRLTNISTPSASSDAASKGYVDGLSFSAALPAGSAAGQVVYYTGTVGNWSSLALLNSAGTAVNLSALGSGSPSSLNYLRGDGTWAAIGSSTFIRASGNTNLLSSFSYMITASNSITLTLPASPTIGDSIRIIDGESITQTVTHILARNGKTIMGLSEDLTLDVVGTDFIIWYNGSDWRLF